MRDGAWSKRVLSIPCCNHPAGGKIHTPSSQSHTMTLQELLTKYRAGTLTKLRKLGASEELAQDVVQEASILALEKFKQLRNKNKFSAWFNTIAVNLFHNTYRGLINTMRNDSTPEEMLLIPDKILTADVQLENYEFETNLAILLSHLPDRQRQAFQLRHVDALSFEEISVIMDCPYNTAKSNYFHGLMKIRNDPRTVSKLTNER